MNTNITNYANFTNSLWLIDYLIKLVTEEKVVLDDIITHTLPLSEAAHGYEIFDKKEEDCVKVVLKP